jgi:hypothetical protein
MATSEYVNNVFYIVTFGSFFKQTESFAYVASNVAVSSQTGQSDSFGSSGKRKVEVIGDSSQSDCFGSAANRKFLGTHSGMRQNMVAETAIERKYKVQQRHKHYSFLVRRCKDRPSREK